MVTLLFVFVEVAPVLSKMIRPEGPYDFILNRLDEEVRIEQAAASQVHRAFMGNEFIEHERSRRARDLAYAGIRSTLERHRIFSDDILREKGRFDEKMRAALSRLQRIRNPKTVEKEQKSIEAIIDAYYWTENLSFAKFHEMLKGRRVNP